MLAGGESARNGQGLTLDVFCQEQMSPKKTHFRTELDLSANLLVSLENHNLDRAKCQTALIL